MTMVLQSRCENAISNYCGDIDWTLFLRIGKAVITLGVQRWLKQIEKLDHLIDAKHAEYQQILAQGTKITPELTGMPHASGTSDKVGETAIRLTTWAEETDAQLKEYKEKKQHIIDIIETLPAKQYEVIHKHYVLYMTWEAVAESMNKSTVQVWRYKKDAYKNLQNVIECNDSNVLY